MICQSLVAFLQLPQFYLQLKKKQTTLIQCKTGAYIAQDTFTHMHEVDIQSCNFQVTSAAWHFIFSDQFHIKSAQLSGSLWAWFLCTCHHSSIVMFSALLRCPRYTRTTYKAVTTIDSNNQNKTVSTLS